MSLSTFWFWFLVSECMPLFCCSHLKKIGWGFTCSLAGMSSLGRSGRYIHTAETRPTADPTGNRGGCPRKQIPEKTERAAETDRPLGFRLWETAMENRSRNPMGNRGLVSALCTNEETACEVRASLKMCVCGGGRSGTDLSLSTLCASQDSGRASSRSERHSHRVCTRFGIDTTT